jgi:chromosome segregation ATPase
MEEETLALTSFGTSLSLSTTLRHSIQSEITSLDASSAALLKNIQNETSIQRGIAKEMERAKREMTELKRGGGDVVENNVVASNVARGWREDLERGIRAALAEFTVVSDNDDDDESKERFMPRQKKILKEKQERISALERELSETNSTLASLEEETNRIQGELQRLNAQNSKMAGEVEKRRIECEGEMRRNVRVKEAIGRSRGNSGMFARGIADKVR